MSIVPSWPGSVRARPAAPIDPAVLALRSHRRWLVAFVVILLLAAVTAPAAHAHGWDWGGGGRDDDAWVGTWSASSQPAPTPLVVAGQTVRNVVRTSIAGDRVRVKLSNAFGTTSMTIGEAHVALRQTGATIAAGTDRTLTFNGSTSIVIPPGAVVVSDPVVLRVPALGDVVVSAYLPQATTIATEHSLGVATTYVSTPGNFTGTPGFSTLTTKTSWYLVSNVEVKVSDKSRAIVTLGDSITDGYGSTVDGNKRWPNRLAERLEAKRGPYRIAVLNAGISGNRVLHDSPIFGVNALARLDRDVLTQSGARWVIVLEGINDIGQPGSSNRPDEEVTADQIIQGHKQIIDRAHAMGLKVYGATLTPFAGTTFPGYYSPAGEVKRQAVNKWIRTSRAYDAVIDFDAAVRDPSDPTKIRPEFDVGDHLHPNDAGYRAMGNAIDLRLFDD